MSESERGFFVNAYRNGVIGFGVSILYNTCFKEFCIWIHIGAFSIYVGYNFSTKEESK
jgi:hypothetical protein